jgi:transketolase
MKVSELKLIANSIRANIINMLSAAGSGHSGGALGLADLFAVLYFDEANISKENYRSDKRDYVFLSNGHVCPVLYATLAEKKFFLKNELLTLRKINSRLQGHPHSEYLPGVENSSGPLGQGISQAVGAAAALKRDKKKNRVYCIISDGELNEGQTWEALMYAAKEKLDNLIIIIDRNKIQIEGDTEEVMPIEPLNKKLTAFNFGVIDFDGNDIVQIRQAFKHARNMKKKPICFIANTVLGKGVSFMEGDYQWHGKAPSEEERIGAIAQLKDERKKIRGEKK